MLFLFLLSIGYVTTKVPGKQARVSLLGMMREWWRAAIIQTKSHSLACSSAPAMEVWFLIDQGLVLVLTHCAGIVDSCSKPNSGTFCRTNHPASSLFLKKQMALKLEEEQLFSLKGEQPSATYEHILSINGENCFLKIREICTWTGY